MTILETATAIVNPGPVAEPLLPLREWLCVQAAWYRQESGDRRAGDAPNTASLIACEIEMVIGLLDFHNATSVAALIARSPVFRKADLTGLGLWGPSVRMASNLADELDRETRRYIDLGGNAALLVAWTINRLADQAEDLGAQDAVDFVALRSAYERSLFEGLQEVEF